jgi:exodeoxyribonuclease V alpha subunit
MLPEMLTLSAIDRQFSAFICRRAGTSSELLRLAVSLLSHAVAIGHVCLDLRGLAGRRLIIDGQSARMPELAPWLAALQQSGVVGEEADNLTEPLPLVLTAVGRLYLRRYWQDEVTVREYLLAETVPLAYDEATVAVWLPRLFTGELDPDWQRVAAVTAVRGRVTVISGGPGTGKTTTVARIMALLALAGGVAGEEISIAAPTGKAAARLGEAIGRALAELPLPSAVTEHLPRTAVTLHRLLGRTNRQGEERQLLARVVIVDEASMVALPLLARLVRALSPTARLILLGDKDQLASVEAGAVLGDLCANPEEDAAKSSPQDRTPCWGNVLADRIVLLRHTYRFGSGSGIGQASRLVCAGASEQALAVCRDGAYPDVTWHDLPAARQLDDALKELVSAGYGPYLANDDPLTALRSFDRFRLLAAVREGEYGVAGLNGRIERLLARQGLVNSRQTWYRGRPVLVTANDYGVRLANGDVGLTLPDPDHGGELRVFFATPDGGVRSIHPLRLPAHETAFALTVHKSQGSEFDTVALLLPPDDLPLLTRELIYTGLTRARSQVHLLANAEIFRAAVGRQVSRSSGLREALWG